MTALYVISTPMKRNIFRLIIFITLSYLFVGCGQGGSGANSTGCTPNVTDSGLQLLITNLGSHTYRFQLCAGSNPSNSVYSVYGGTDIPSLQNGTINLAGAWRQKTITATNSAGQYFQVTFQSGDQDFAIYQDVSNGNGGFNLDSTKSMVNPRALNF
jgi:hypothetical protein